MLIIVLSWKFWWIQRNFRCSNCIHCCSQKTDMLLISIEIWLLGIWFVHISTQGALVPLIFRSPFILRISTKPIFFKYLWPIRKGSENIRNVEFDTCLPLTLSISEELYHYSRHNIFRFGNNLPMKWSDLFTPDFLNPGHHLQSIPNSWNFGMCVHNHIPDIRVFPMEI